MTAVERSTVAPAVAGWIRALAGAAPRTASTIAVTMATAISLAPSLLPRGAATQAVLTGVFVTLGLACAAVWHRLASARSCAQPPARRPRVALYGVVLVGCAVTQAHHWQNELRTAMGVDSVGTGHWLAVLTGAAAIAVGIVGAGRLVAAAIRRAGTRRFVAATVVTVTTAAGWAVPASATHLAHADRSHDAIAVVAEPGPDSAAMSGGPGSLTPWATLGTHGRRFVTAPARESVVRTYVGLDAAPDLDSRIDLAVRELDRAGGFDKGHLVVSVPTGSGWIDAAAVEGLEQRFDGDVAEVAVQYSAAPSWVTYVFDRRAAEQSARALYGAVVERAARLSPERRPKVYLYGQSLGAIGAAAAIGSAGSPCGAVFAGPPATAVPRAGATVLANRSDPVVWWSPRLLVHPPDLDAARVDAPVPPWLPLISFVQTTVELLVSLDAPAGHGHRYGADQGTAMPGCDS